MTVSVGRVLDGVAYATLADTPERGDADHVRGGGREADSRTEPKEGADEGRRAEAVTEEPIDESDESEISRR